jgi:uracil-DNA glycosylase family 4
VYGNVAAPTETAPLGGLIPPPSAEPFAAPLLSVAEKIKRLAALDENEVRGCTRCRLCEGCNNTVFGEGDPDAKVFFIGEGPGENEDLQSRPFVGRAGEMLNKWIAAMGLRRDQVYIANIVKCRPPNNRVPAPDEVATCTPYLQRQLEIVRPQVIVTLGLPSAKYMLQSNLSMGRLRGQWHEWREHEQLDWPLLQDPKHQGLRELNRELARVYRNTPQFYASDCDAGGFRWGDLHNADESVFAFLRQENGHAPVI